MAKGDPTNQERAERAVKALRFYQEKARTDISDDLYEIMADLMTDMMHLARFEGIGFDKAVKAAKSYFKAEVEEGEGPRSWSPRGWKGIR